MINVYWYYLPSGRIVGFETNSEPSGENYILAPDGSLDYSKHYVLDGAIQMRPINTTVLTNNALSNLPVPCKIVINNTVYDCNDTFAELEFVYPGTYTIKIDAFPYLDADFEVTV